MGVGDDMIEDGVERFGCPVKRRGRHRGSGKDFDFD